MNEKDCMLSTYDNPFNPFDDFDIWWKTDLSLGHDCCGYLAKVANTSEIFSDSVNNELIDNAMNEIIESDPTIYRKVTRADYSRE